MLTDKGDFIRKQYLHIDWFNKTGKKLTDADQPFAEINCLDIYCELKLNRAGSFHFYFTYEDGLVHWLFCLKFDRKFI